MLPARGSGGDFEGIAGHRRWSAAMFGLTAPLLGLVVVAVKIALSHELS